MEFCELIRERRSVRSYEQCSISEDDIKDIIAAAQNAPSWKNSQTARYYAAITPEAISAVSSNALPEFNQKNSSNAAYIITTYVKNRAGFNREGVPDNELGNEWGAYDLGLANMLVLLRAKELGYDTLVMGIRDSDALRSILGIEDSEQVVSVIAVGKRTEGLETGMPKRKDICDILRFF